MRRTKIVATLGPSTESVEILRELIQKGVNVFRLNMSHGRHEWVREIVPRIRRLSGELHRPVGILMDTQGPAIRTGELANELNLKVGDLFVFTVRGHVSEELYSVDTNYDDLINDIQVGDVVLVDNGILEMQVREKREKEILCEVLTPGKLSDRRHINLPGVRVNLPALTAKDLADVDLGMELGVDWIALSFVREASDIEKLRDLLRRHQCEHIGIVAKIENQLAMKNLREIVHATDAVMVARGDLGIECPYYELPIIQRRIVKHCLAERKPVIVATHLLESMISNPMPTRAEITDVANAVFENADAIMLSGETAVGRYPVRCVEVLDAVANRIETSGNLGLHREAPLETDRQRLAASGISLANHMKAAGVVVFTRSGQMAETCASLRPLTSRIFAFTPSATLPNRLALLFGVWCRVLAFDSDPESTIHAAIGQLLAEQEVVVGDRLVIISDVLARDETVSSIQIRVAGEKPL